MPDNFIHQVESNLLCLTPDDLILVQRDCCHSFGQTITCKFLKGESWSSINCFLAFLETKTIEDKDVSKVNVLGARLTSASKEIENLQTEIYKLRRSISRQEMGSSRACDTNKTELTSDCQVNELFEY